MDRRHFVKAGAAALAARLPPASAGTAVPAAPGPAQSLVAASLATIARLDKTGPAINAMIELNPDALRDAADLDRERREGKLRGPLHGIPVVIKDNIATGDRTSTSAGSLALDGVRASRDAFLVGRLRNAGAVILGKTNMTEWANMRSMNAIAGWSARGGLTRNPYALDRSCGGSSSGSGAAVAAGMASLAVGTETDGSIVCPASICGLVGIKPTVGLVSRSGIIRITSSQDTAGPMAATVAEAALLLAAMAGRDAADPATARATPADYAASLDRDGLRGMRIGVARNCFVRERSVNAVIARELRVLQAQGALLVDVQLPNQDRYRDSYADVMLTEFKAELPAWLADYAPHARIRNLADLIAFNCANAAREMAYFKQEVLVYAQRASSLGDVRYREALATCRHYARVEGIDRVMAEHRLDALVAPTSVPGWVLDFKLRSKPGAPGFTTPAAVAGYPHITVPAGRIEGLPVGLSFVGRAWSEAALIRMAYAYEQATLHRQAPRFLPSSRPA